MAREKTNYGAVSALILPSDYSLTGKGENDGVSQSLITTYLTCKVKFVIAVNRLRRMDGAFNTGFGSLYHDMLDKTYTTFKETNALPNRADISDWIEVYNEEKTAEFGSMDLDTIERNGAVCEEVLVAYIDFWMKDFKQYSFEDIEGVFDIRFGKYRIRGKRDGVLRCKKDGSLWLFEHKTKSRVMEEIIQQSLANDFQCQFYCAAWKAEKKTPLRGVQYNIIRNPGIKTKKGESLRALQKRLGAEIRKDPEHYFKRYPQSYSSDEQARFERNLTNILEDMHQFTRNKVIFANTTACNSGFYPCSHLPACSSDKLSFYKKSEKLFTELQPASKE